jgi:cell division protein FtsI (penicillin-binding protein 3)
MKNFIRLFFLIKLLIFCAILGQGANIQILPHTKLDQFKNVQFFKTIKIQARRGRIYDRKDKELAINEPTYSVFADPVNVKSARLTANKVSRLLNANPKFVESKLNRQTRFVWLKRRIDLNTKNDIQKLNLSGIHFVSEPQRQYPGRDTSTGILGFVGSEGRGLEGLEYFYDDYLSGKDVDLRVSRDAKGRPLSIDPEQYTNPPEGQDLQLTIDSEYQQFLELQLKKAFEDHKPKSAFGLVLDTQTGAIRASAQWSSENQRGSGRSLRAVKNNLFHEALEQGSTIKPFAAAAAIESGLFKPGSEFACLDGKINIGRRVITDAKKIKCESMTLTEGLKVSSNVVFTQLALGLGETPMREFYNKLGFGDKTNIDFPGEARGLYKSDKWPKHLLVSASFGHGFTATPIQVASAYAAIANDGIWNQPHLVDKIIAPSGLEKKLERTNRRVMSETTAQVLKAMLTEVTQPGGTGKNAAVDGYLVAGKTGTANKVDLINGGYYKDKYFSSFVGMFPSEKPRFVVYIGVDEPTDKYYGSEVAAPVFAKVAQFILNKENIAPTNILPQQLVNCMDNKCGYQPEIKNTTDSLLGLTLREALRFIKNKPVKARFQGKGLVTKVIFEKGTSINEESKVLIKFE